MTEIPMSREESFEEFYINCQSNTGLENAVFGLFGVQVWALLLSDCNVIWN